MADQLVLSPGLSDARSARDDDSPLARIAHRLAGNLTISIALLIIVLAGLPLAVWLDLRELSENALRRREREQQVARPGVG